MGVWFESSIPGSCSGCPLSSRFGSGCSHLSQASFGLPPLSPGAGAVPAWSRRWPLRCPSHHRHHHHHVGFHLWPGCFTPSRAVLKEKLKISLPRENLQVLVSSHPFTCTFFAQTIWGKKKKRTLWEKKPYS